MKKSIIGLVLVLVLGMLLCTSALAVAPNDAALFKQTSELYQYVAGVAGEGNTIYALVSEPDGYMYYNLYKYTLGQENPELVADKLFCTKNYSSIADTQYVEDWDNTKALGMLFVKDEMLYSFNTLTGDFSTVTAEGGKLTLTTKFTFDISSFMVTENDYTYMMYISASTFDGENLYLAFEDYSKGESQFFVIAVSLADGSMKKISDQAIRSLTPYKDGKLLCLLPASWDDKSQKLIDAQLGELDGETGEIIALGVMENSNGLRYQASNDTLYYVVQDCIMAMPGLGTPQRVAYAATYATDNTVLLDTHYVVWGSDALYVRNVDPQYLPTTVLTVSGSYRGSEAAVEFGARYPDIPLMFENGYYDINSLGQAMIGGDKTVDMIQFRVDDGFDSLLAKGYCADLSSSEKLMTFVKSLYPSIQDELMVDGKLYAVPMYLYATNFTFSPGNIGDVGLTKEDLPTNYIEMCEFITLWNNEMAEEYDDYTPFHTGYLRIYLFNHMLKDYIAYYDSIGEALDFDTPLFNSLLTALDAMDTSNLDLPEKPTDADYDELYKKKALFDGGMSTLSESRGDYKREPLLLSLDSQTPYVLSASMTVNFVNPRTENLEEAIMLLECYMDKIPQLHMVTMSPDMNDEILNPYYEENVKGWEEYLATLQADILTCDPAMVKEYESEIVYFQNLLDNQEDYKYELSAKTIQFFRANQGEHLAMKHRNILAANDAVSEQLNTLHERYLNKQMTKEQYIKDLNQKARMIVLENR